MQKYPRTVNIDDDDGHYIVVPDASLTDSCTSNYLSDCS